jgi:hypothetical protein
VESTDLPSKVMTLIASGAAVLAATAATGLILLRR